MAYTINFIIFVVLYNLVCVKCACPDVASVEYDLKKLEGLWYDVAISKNEYKYGHVFADTRYNVEGDEVKITSESSPKNARDYFEGQGERLSNGKIHMKYTVGHPGVIVDTTLSILALDDDFLTLHACSYNKERDFTVEILRSASKVRKPEGEVKTKIDNFLNTFKSLPSMGAITWVKRD